MKEEHMIGIAPNPAIERPRLSDGSRERQRVLVVDDHAAVRAGLQRMLDDQADFNVIAAVDSAEAAMSVAEREPIDVAVVDYQLGSRNGLWLSRKLKRLPDPPRVVIYSAFADGVLAAAAVVAEADGIVSKGELGSELSEAIRGVVRGERYLPAVPAWLADALRRRLGQEEQAIFGMLLAGIKPAEIADTLNLSAGGFESCLWTMLRKIEAPASEPRLSHGARRRR
jgi:DNA-binding NarL/FixJ family response regulator